MPRIRSSMNADNLGTLPGASPSGGRLMRPSRRACARHDRGDERSSTCIDPPNMGRAWLKLVNIYTDRQKVAILSGGGCRPVTQPLLPAPSRYLQMPVGIKNATDGGVQVRSMPAKTVSRVLYSFAAHGA